MNIWEIIASQGKQYLKDAAPGGLLNPEMNYAGMRKAAEVASMTPTPLGDAMSGLLAVDDLRNKQYGSAALNSIGLLPFVPSFAGTFIGKGAKTWDAAANAQAMQMAKEGADPRTIWKETGNWKAPDGMWRQEIPDNAADFKQAPAIGKSWFEDLLDDGYTQIGEALDHPALYRAYGNLQDTPLNYGKGKGQGARYSQTEGVTVNEDTWWKIPGKEWVKNNWWKDAPTGPKSAILHEGQHAIQDMEGWAKGGSPGDMRQILGNGELTGLYSPQELNDAYRRLAGEAEARATQARMRMSAQQRLKNFPEDSYDIPINQLIIRGILGR